MSSAPTELLQPKAVVTFETAQESAKTIWVTEDHDEVKRQVDTALGEPHPPLITLTRWTVSASSPFSTRPENVATVEPYR